MKKGRCFKVDFERHPGFDFSETYDRKNKKTIYVKVANNAFVKVAASFADPAANAASEKGEDGPLVDGVHSQPRCRAARAPGAVGPLVGRRTFPGP